MSFTIQLHLELEYVCMNPLFIFIHFQSADGATSSGGTMVDIAAVKQAVIKAAESMGIKPTCLHDVHL